MAIGQLADDEEGAAMAHLRDALPDEYRVLHSMSSDHYLDAHLRDPAFAERFRRADEAWASVVGSRSGDRTRRGRKAPGGRASAGRPTRRERG